MFRWFADGSLAIAVCRSITRRVRCSSHPRRDSLIAGFLRDTLCSPVCAIFVGVLCAATAGCGPELVVSNQAAAVKAVDRDSFEHGQNLARWPMWRGPGSSGIAPGGSPPVTFGPTRGVRWQLRLPGSGNSSPVAWDACVYLTTALTDLSPPMLALMAIDRRSGGVRWQSIAGEAKGATHPKNGYASASIATDGQRLFAFFGGAGLFAFTLDGKLLWRADLGPAEHQWGVASSPVLFENLVIQQCDVEADAAKSFLAAFDQATGREVWRTPRPSRGSWSTPLLIAVDADGNACPWPPPPSAADAERSGAPHETPSAARVELIVNGTTHEPPSHLGWVIAYDPRSGKELWRVSGTTGLVTPTPVLCGRRLISLSGRKGAVMAIQPAVDQAGNDVTATNVVWSAPSDGPYIPTGIGYRNRLYVIDDRGDVTCYDPGNGSKIWNNRLRGAFTASLVAADGRIYAASEQGDVDVFAAAPNFTLLARNALGEPILATPAIVDGDLLVRTATQLYCFAASAQHGNATASLSPALSADDSTAARKAASGKPGGEATSRNVDGTRPPAREAVPPRAAAVSAAGIDAWPLFRGDAHSTGVAGAALPEKLAQRWRFTISGDDGFETSPVIANDTVFIGTARGDFLAVDLEHGKERWRVANSEGFAAAAAFRDGRVYVGDKGGVFHCIDAVTGRPLWRFDSEAEIDSAPNFYGDYVLFGSQDGHLYCLDRSGKEVWKYDAADQVRSMPSIVGDRATVAGCDGRLQIVDLRTGILATSVELEGPTGCTAAILGDRAYVGIEGNAFWAIDWAAGRSVWKFESPSRSAAFRSSAAVTPQMIVVGSRDNRIYGLDPLTGEPRWSFATRGFVDASPLVAGARVYVGSSDGRFYVLALGSGKELDRFEAGGPILGGAAAGRGNIVFATDKGDLYCLGAAP